MALALLRTTKPEVVAEDALLVAVACLEAEEAVVVVHSHAVATEPVLKTTLPLPGSDCP